jgi:outer membrane receptor protein involved in Fe transport
VAPSDAAKQQEAAAKKAAEARKSGAASAAAEDLLAAADTPTAARTPADVAGTVVTVVIVVLFARQVLSTIGLEGLAVMIDRLISYLPQVLIAAFIVGGGLWVGRFVQDKLADWTSRSRDRVARHAGAIARFTIIGFATILTAEELGVGPRLITLAFGLLLGAVCLAAAVAFGLGGREVAGKILAKEYAERQLEK